MKFYAVIGANYGDEGKGLTTDWLCRMVRPTRVVRFNGGAQAGHTVCTDTERHVFSSYGSGTLAGVPTELTRNVIINPYAVLRERETLRSSGKEPPRIYHTDKSPITTQFEVAINQAVEKRRGNERHGSCGMGINETVERHLAMEREVPSLLPSLYHANTVTHAFSWIRMEWVPRRMKQLGFGEDEISALVSRSVEYDAAYIECLKQAQILCLSEGEERTEGPIVYEGAQGLALDEELGAFPFVTRSNTGLRNVLHDIKERTKYSSATHTLNVFYPTRTYLTRHGRGPLENEDQAVNILCGSTHKDETNFTNPWQEHLRYAPLHVADTCLRIKQDYERNEAFLKTELPHLTVRQRSVLTCCDQAGAVRLVDNSLEPTPLWGIANRFNRQGLPVAFLSYGPSASSVMMSGFDLRGEG